MAHPTRCSMGFKNGVWGENPMAAKRKPGRLMRHGPPTRDTMLAPNPISLRAVVNRFWGPKAPPRQGREQAFFGTTAGGEQKMP